MNSTTSSEPTLVDRLRIERVVWTLDSHLENLPYRSKRAKRRETRANLYAATADVGTAEAIRGLGNLRRLAADYLAAEYGERGPRPSYTTGTVCLLVVHVFAAVIAQVGKAAFTAGIVATTPHATGVFHWQGVPYLVDEATITLNDGTASTMAGGAWTPLVYLSAMVAFVLGGRLWRLLPQWRRQYANTPTSK